MPEDKKSKTSDKEVKEALHRNEHSIDLPKKDKSKKVWIILFVITFIALVGLAILGYMKLQESDKKIKDQQAQIDDLENKKKSLEEAAAKAVSSAAASANASSYLEIKELGFKLPLSADIKDLQYFVNDKTAYFSTASLQSSAWPSANNDATKFCSIGSMPLGVITKFNNTNDAGPNQQKVLNGFVLGYAPPQSSCSTNQATINLQNNQKASLLNAFNKAEKI